MPRATWQHSLDTSAVWAVAIAPSTGCTAVADVGKKELVSYTADYFFYKSAHGKHMTRTRIWAGHPPAHDPDTRP